MLGVLKDAFLPPNQGGRPECSEASSLANAVPASPMENLRKISVLHCRMMYVP